MDVLLMALISAAIAPEPESPARRAMAERPLVELFSYEDFPRDAQLRGSTGTTQVRLSVGTDGRALNCEVVASAGDASLDTAACNILLERSRFVPAQDHSGRVVPDVVTTRIRWEIGRIQQFEQSSVVTNFEIEDGVPRCSVSWRGQEGAAPVSYCTEELGGFAVLLTQPDVRGLRVESIFVPDNEMRRAEITGSSGELLWRYSGELSIAPNGTVSRCEVTQSEASSPILTELIDESTACAAFSGERYEEIREGRDLRRARFESAYFIVRRSDR
jgi:TonB family protein